MTDKKILTNDGYVPNDLKPLHEGYQPTVEEPLQKGYQPTQFAVPSGVGDAKGGYQPPKSAGEHPTEKAPPKEG